MEKEKKVNEIKRQSDQKKRKESKGNDNEVRKCVIKLKLGKEKERPKEEEKK